MHLDLDPAFFYRWDSAGPRGDSVTIPDIFFSFEEEARGGIACSLIFFVLPDSRLSPFVETSTAPLFFLDPLLPLPRHYLGKTISLPLLLTNPFPCSWTH